MLVIGGTALLLYSKIDIHLSINHFNNNFGDFFFRYWTYVGDGVFVAIAAIIIAFLLFSRKGWTPFIFGASLLITSGLSVQFLKRYIFDGSLRPSAYITDHTLYLIEGVDMHVHHSFPSGHTTIAFAFFGFVSLFLAKSNKWLQIVFALCAGLIGYSRMYLSQHFLEDVVAGLLLGTFCFVLMLILFNAKLAKN